MPLFYTVNTVSRELLSDVEPWEFKATEVITAQIRGNKEDRQEWYRNVNTKHCFYTGVEPLNPRARPNKENPPYRVHALVADYDTLKLPEARVDEAISMMPLKPMWKEQSLGLNWRLVWVFEIPALLCTMDFSRVFFEKAIEWLSMDLLPMLDRKAAEDPIRLFCNGCVWKPTGHGKLSAADTQSFLFRVAKEFSFVATAEDRHVSLEDVHEALAKKFPDMSWPSAFVEESQGPSFWVPGSESPNSAVVKREGMFTFSAHATKNFYPWGDPDLLGREFVEGKQNQSIAKAVTGVFWDRKHFYALTDLGAWRGVDEGSFVQRLQCNCKLSSRSGKDGKPSMVTEAINYVKDHQNVDYSAPFAFRKPGAMFLGPKRRILNTYSCEPVQPAAGTQKWGEFGEFPAMSMHFNGLFNPTEKQIDHFLAWYQNYFRSAFEWAPTAGQHLFLLGGVGVGKTLTNRRIIGTSVGGFTDASKFIVGGEDFNGHLFEIPHWCVDDDSPAQSAIAQARVAAALKKLAANAEFMHNEKFRVAGMVVWMARCCVTANLDFVSSRIVGTLDNSSLDKISLFRCNETPSMNYPPRAEMDRIIDKEMPYFLRYLLDYKVPDFVEPDSRYTYKSYHEPTLLAQTHQASPAAPFKELLIEALDSWFQTNPDQTEYRGNTTQIQRLMLSVPGNSEIMRSSRLDQTARYLEQIQREKVIACETAVGPAQTRIWIIKRDETLFPRTPQDPANQPPASTGAFAK
jgi:hypothetical protein